MGLWYQTINPKSVLIGPCQFKNAWLMQENKIGIEPDIKAMIARSRLIFFTRYFWNPIKEIICGSQFNKPINVKDALLDILLIEKIFKKFIRLLINKSKQAIKKKILYLSFTFILFPIKLIIKDKSKTITAKEKAEGNRNNPK